MEAIFYGVMRANPSQVETGITIVMAFVAMWSVKILFTDGPHLRGII